jgi:nitrogen fixation protein NifB
MESLQALQEADILCKVNSVMIPGINDDHLPEVDEVIRSKGAFLHNIMPLISAPEHGTYFGLNGQRGPTPKELKALQDKCSGNMKMMRHCRQCRADAVGLLGEDRSQEFTKDKFMEMPVEYDLQKRQEIHAGISAKREAIWLEKAQAKLAQAAVHSPKILVAVATKGGGVVNQHFGHAREFMIYEVDATGARFVGHRKLEQYCQGGYGEDDALDGILTAIADCKAVLVSKIGECPLKSLQKAGIQVVQSYDVIEKVASEFYQQWLAQEIPTDKVLSPDLTNEL